MLLVGYLSFVNSCMTMRNSVKETQTYFEQQNVAYVDSTIIISDREIHYIMTGNDEAPTLVFVHGSPGSWDAWESYMSDHKLLEQYRMIAMDRPGFGHSDFRKSLNLEAQAQVLNQFLNQLGNGRPMTLIGHSYGGPLIVKMALEDASSYENLVILAGALDPEAEHPEKWRKPLTWIPLKYLVPGALKPSNDELWMLKQDLIDLKPELAGLSQKVIIIHGTVDKLVPYQNVPFMEGAFVNAAKVEVIRLENERHFIVWDREDLIKDTLLKLTD